MTESESGLLAEYPDVLRGAEVAEILRLDPRTVQRKANAGELPAFRVGDGERAEWRYETRRMVALIEGGDAWAVLPPLLGDRPAVLTTEEVAEILRFDRATVASMAAEGALPGAFKPGGGRTPWRFSTRALSAVVTDAGRPAP
ncbi:MULTISPECIES: helix-turn-helix domain-containing protein [unclassified Streptomyces]|uniref:helix-turn-helix domain-containing protein n=1 Tax=unclassified Streptomyces TaxID=2593676 RepID=UPI0033E5B400